MLPDMITVTMALDKADQENGCLQVMLTFKIRFHIDLLQ